MYGIQWIKLDKSIFNNRKIQLILGLREGDTYFRIWIQLLTLGVECGADGRLVIGNKPLSIEQISKIVGKSLKITAKILDKFIELEMLKVEDDMFIIKNWNKYQSVDKYEEYKEKNRDRQRKYREKLKNESEINNVTVTSCNVVEEKKEEKIKKELLKENNIREEEESGFREYKF